jgi:hypothetical protein
MDVIHVTKERVAHPKPQAGRNRQEVLIWIRDHDHAKG